MALPRRAPAAASDSEANLSSSVATRDLMAAYAFSTARASGSTTSGSGTYTTTYPSSRDSVMSSDPDLASQMSRIHLSSGFEDDDEEKLNSSSAELVKEFCHSDGHGDGDIGAVVERWLSELGVGWVLDLSDNPSAGTSLLPRAQRNLTENWIRALNEIKGSTLRFVRKLGVMVFKETVLKMLPYVDVLVLAAADLFDAGAGSDNADATNVAQVPSAEKLRTLLDVRDAVSSASEGIQLYFRNWHSSVETEAQRSSDEVLSFLSAKEQMLDKAVWSTMEEVRTSFLNDDDDNEWGIQSPQGSSEICKVTRSLITYIKYLLLWGSIRHRPMDPLTTLTKDMVYSLRVKLAKRSESFPDQSLGLIFVINNMHFMWQQLHPLFRMKFHMGMEIVTLTSKVEYYILKYLQVSWEPVLSCLYNHTFRWFSKNSALSKFDLEFQKTYSAQKHWKVPDPELRTRLRKAIVEKVVSGFTNYLEDNNVTNPGITPLEREEMLLELFEG